MNNWKKKFIIIWTGQLFSILSSFVTQFAIVLWISMETGSAEVLAYATIAGLLPQIIIGPFAGVFVDRWNRKWTMIGADSFVALCSLIMAVLFYYDMMDLWWIYVLLMLRSIGSAFHTPAMKSSAPLLAPESELTRIAGINQALQSVCNILGPALGAILVVSFDMSVVMMLDVAGAAIACTSLLFVAIPRPPKSMMTSARGILKEMWAGFGEICKNRGISWIMCSEIAISFFIMPMVVLIPLMTLKHFGGTPYQVGMVDMIFGIGSLIGGVILGVWNPKNRKVIMLLCAYFGFGGALLICGFLPPSGYLWFVVLALIQGFCLPFYTGPFTALLQTQIEASYLGRVFSMFDSLSLLPSILGLLATAHLADVFGIPIIFIMGGSGAVLTAIVMFLIPSVMQLERKKVI